MSPLHVPVTGGRPDLQVIEVPVAYRPGRLASRMARPGGTFGRSFHYHVQFEQVDIRIER